MHVIDLCDLYAINNFTTQIYAALFVDIFIRPLVHCALHQCGLLAVGTPVRKAFTTDVGQMQRRRHYMTERDRHLSGLV